MLLQQLSTVEFQWIDSIQVNPVIKQTEKSVISFTPNSQATLCV